MKPKVQEIAIRAGVSAATVSRFINSSGYVKNETRNTIEKCIKELENENLYVKSNSHQKHITSKNIAIIIPDISNPLFIDIIQEIEEIAEAKGYTTIVINTNESEEREHRILQNLESLNLIGIILTPVSDRTEYNLFYIKQLEKLNIPVVLIDRDIKFSDFDGVFVDNKKGAFDATKKLLELGKKNISIITGPLTSKPGRERLSGFKEAHEVLGIEMSKSNIFEGDFKIQSGYIHTRYILENNIDTDALFICNNMMIIGALKAFDEYADLDKGNITLIGFDEIDPVYYNRKSISCISRPTKEMGRIAMDMLDKRINSIENYSSQRVVLKPQFTIENIK
jgi:LacI family transcriptional regulator